jgi:hypothetical protein
MIFVQGNSVIYTCVSSFLSTIRWRGCLFFIVCFWHLYQESDNCSCRLIFGSYILFFLSMCLPVWQCCAVLLLLLRSIFETRYCDTASTAPFAQNCFDYSGVLCFLKNFKIVFSSSVKHVVRILMEIALNLQIAFNSMAIFTTLILEIHELKSFKIF